LVTVTFHAPATAVEGIENIQVIFDADWATTPVPDIVVDVVTFASLTVAPGRKLVPAMLVMVTIVPANPVSGMMLLTVGAGYDVVSVVVTVSVGIVVAVVGVTTGTWERELTWVTFAG